MTPDNPRFSVQLSVEDNTNDPYFTWLKNLAWNYGSHQNGAYAVPTAQHLQCLQQHNIYNVYKATAPRISVLNGELKSKINQSLIINQKKKEETPMLHYLTGCPQIYFHAKI